jgi:hypothetical protein
MDIRQLAERTKANPPVQDSWQLLPSASIASVNSPII